jgi:hypothetical protein
LLTTVRGGALPRIHPITLAIVDDRLLAFIILDSPKARDLAEDGRYALHSHLDLDRPHEFSVRGRARAVDDGWPFGVDDSYRLFELLIDHAVAGTRATAHDWPPRYTSWRSSAE